MKFICGVCLLLSAGNSSLAQQSLPVATEENPPSLRIAQRMRLEPAQLDGVEKRIQVRERERTTVEQGGTVVEKYMGESDCMHVQNNFILSFICCLQLNNEHCLLLALPCGRDPEDVQAQTHTLKTSLIAYLLQKQAAGIINMPGQQQVRRWNIHS